MKKEKKISELKIETMKVIMNINQLLIYGLILKYFGLQGFDREDTVSNRLEHLREDKLRINFKFVSYKDNVSFITELWEGFQQCFTFSLISNVTLLRKITGKESCNGCVLNGRSCYQCFASFSPHSCYVCFLIFLFRLHTHTEV